MPVTVTLVSHSSESAKPEIQAQEFCIRRLTSCSRLPSQRLLPPSSLVPLPVVTETMDKMGWGASDTLARSLGIITIVCTLLYSVPPTSILGAILLTASRAIGETMIVVLAAGVAANLTLNPFEAMTTITVKIVNQLTGDLEFNSPQTLVAFALGITLFALTLVMNIVALYIVRKYREQYE